ncbi:hypothetical protein BKA66DRAFT_423949 [Pyrenochaeta sp. MPI-SDFR-AT-0127]|nr:hypothetical protein BKA66DRAFT_423949 [Pyrenochaeta sp. MPI-SDFR-AT-0127]
MLTIAEVSGLIAAAVVIVQYVLPAAIAVILVKYVGKENTAVTWSVVNRYISNTIWPHILRADAVSSRHVSTSTSVLTWTSTIGAAMLILASVLAPLGLSEKIQPGASRLVEFEYIKDPTPWGRVTMPRPNLKFARYCEVGLAINCPGQYQGTYMNETEPGRFISVETDESSTINTTIPRNYTVMFRSATSDQGNTISGLFDMQFRRWRIDRVGSIDKGQPWVKGESREIESLIPRDTILLKEGLIVDMRENPGIGFRNHTVPVGLEYGGLWSEDITWIEPVTQCADTNISADLRIETSVNSFGENETVTLIDRGAFIDLHNSDIESRPWVDNQTLDLFAHAHKAARMHNVLVASSLGISLPLNTSTKILPPRPVGTGFFSTSRFNDNHAQMLTATEQICEGLYRVSTLGTDNRAANITNPAIKCGTMLGAPRITTNQSLAASTFTGVETSRKNVYICATAYKASIKTVNFRYNGTGGDFTNLEVLNIAPKTYPNDAAKPLWAVEHSFDRVMRFDPLWGLVNDSYETTLGFHTLRSESLWLPTGPGASGGFGELEGYDSVAASGGFLKRLGNLYRQMSLRSRDYSGSQEFALSERWSRLSSTQTTASHIPSLILTDGLAAGLVGTKTSFSSKYVEWPAMLAVDDNTRGFAQNKVQVYKRVIQYDIRYAIPSFVVLALLLAALAGAFISSIIAPTIVGTMQRMYNQTSAGRLITSLLQPGRSDPTQSSDAWVNDEGKLRLAFGRITSPEDDYFCRIVDKSSDVESKTEGINETTKAERGHLLTGSAQ